VESFAYYAKQLNHSVCYNGDILNVADVERVQMLAPQIDKFMIGRGILQNPFLLAEIRKQELTREQKVKMLRNFHISIIEHCKQKYSGDLHLLKRLEELWEYHAEGFENGRKIYKLVKKSKTLVQYEAVVFKAINEME